MMYTGGDGSNSTEHSHTHSTLMKLMQKYLNKGHTLFTDNFYTSPKLFLDLLNDGTYACGTIPQNQKYFPDELKNTYLNRSAYQFAIQKTFTVGIWHDRMFCFLALFIVLQLKLWENGQKEGRRKNLSHAQLPLLSIINA